MLYITTLPKVPKMHTIFRDSHKYAFQFFTEFVQGPPFSIYFNVGLEAI